MVAISELDAPRWFNLETGAINDTEYREPSGKNWISGSSPQAQEALRTGMLTRSDTYVISTQEAERRSGKTMHELGARGLASAVGGRITERGITLTRTVKVPFTPTRYKQVDFPGSEKVTGIAHVFEEKAPVVIKRVGEEPPKVIEEVLEEPTKITKEVKEGEEFVRVNVGSPKESVMKITTTKTGREEYEVTQTEMIKKTYENGVLVSTEVVEKATEGNIFNVPLMVSQTRQAGGTATMGSAGTKAVLVYPVYSVEKEWLGKEAQTPEERVVTKVKYETAKPYEKVLLHASTILSGSGTEYLKAVAGKRETKEVVVSRLAKAKPMTMKEALKQPSTYIEGLKSPVIQTELMFVGGGVLGVASKTGRGATLLQSKLVQAGLLAGIGYEGVQTGRRVKEEVRKGDIGAGIVEAGLFGAYLGVGVAGFKVGAKAVVSSAKVVGLKTKDTHETIRLINKKAKLSASYKALAEIKTKVPLRKPKYEYKEIPVDISGAGKITKGGKKFDIDTITRSGQEQISFARLKGTTDITKHKVDIDSILSKTKTMGKREVRLEELKGRAEARTDVMIRKGKIKEFLDIPKKEIIKRERVEFGKPTKRMVKTDVDYTLQRITQRKPSELKEFTKMDFVNKRINDVMDQALSAGRAERKIIIKGTGKKKTGGYQSQVDIIKAKTIEVRSGFKPKVVEVKPKPTAPKKPITPKKPIKLMKAKIKTTTAGRQRLQLERKLEPTQKVGEVVDTTIQKEGIRTGSQELAKIQAESIARYQQQARASINTGQVGRISGITAIASVEDLIQQSMLQQDRTLRISMGTPSPRQLRIRMTARERQRQRPITDVTQITAQISKQTQAQTQKMATAIRTKTRTDLVRTTETFPPLVPEISITRIPRIFPPFIPLGYGTSDQETQALNTRLKTITHDILELF